MYLLGDVFNTIADFITRMGSYLTFDIILYIFLGLEAVVLVFFTISSQFSYEVSLLRSIDKINAYLFREQYVNEKNLVEFNRKMKKMPKVFRYHWQQYMLSREEKPSYYMSIYNCVEVPLKSSYFSTCIRTLNYLSIIIAALGFIVSSAYLSAYDVSTAEFFYKAPIIPIVIMIADCIFLLALRVRQSTNKEDLFQTFNVFNLFIDKATTTLPEYVDFEVLFTKKEIKKGIPVLNEYIEKRRLKEQEDLKKARENAIEIQSYNFESVEEKGALVLERAMKETELFLHLRERLLNEINQLETQIEGFKKNYESTNKEIQKKLQATKENIERLNEQQQETTNRIELNYIKKQLADEIKKQQQYEKDNDDAANRYKQEVSTLFTDINAKEKELADAKDNVEKAMSGEYRTFASKTYKDINSDIEKRVAGEKEELIDARVKTRNEYEKCLNQLDSKERENEELKSEVERLKAQINQVYAKQNQAQNAEQTKKDKKSWFGKKTEEVKEEHVVEEAPKAEQKTDEYGGFYDNQGYYRYPNGTYYDPQGNYYDLNGGYFDPAGVYHTTETKVESQRPPIAPITQETKVEKTAQVEVNAETTNPVVETVITTVEEKPVEEKAKRKTLTAQERLDKLKAKSSTTKKTTTVKKTTIKKTTEE